MSLEESLYNHNYAHNDDDNKGNDVDTQNYIIIF